MSSSPPLSIQELQHIATASEAQAVQNGRDNATLVQPIHKDGEVLDLTLSARESSTVTPDEENAPLPNLPSILPQTETTPNHNRRSIRSIPAHDIAPLLTTTSKLNPTTSNINIEDMRRRVIGGGYTGSKVAMEIVLEWLQDEMDFCDSDKIRDIRAYGEPKQSMLSKVLETYVTIKHPSNTSKTWGKTMGSVFRYLARSLWPSTHKHKTVKQLTRGRKLYGIRLKEEHSQPTTNRHLNTTNLQRTPNAAQKRSHAFTTPSPTLFGHVPKQPVSKRPRSQANANLQQSGTFTPYYDIIHNDYLYCVRVFLPLMAATAARKLNIAVSFSQRSCSISGSYWPSTRIGTKSAEVLSLTQPMLPHIYAPPRHNGQFSIHVVLPPDIKDGNKHIETIHDNWGLLIPFERRKITHTVSVSLQSCFGGTKFSPQQASVSASPSVKRRLNTPTRNPPPQPLDNTTVSLVVATPPNSPQDAKDHTLSEDPKSLVGLTVQVPGIKWGAQYKGRTYPGTVMSTRKASDDAEYFTIEFEDCHEELDLDEMLKYKFISQEDHIRLKPACYPPSE